jgi:hypothetical protein
MFGQIYDERYLLEVYYVIKTRRQCLTRLHVHDLFVHLVRLYSV